MYWIIVLLTVVLLYYFSYNSKIEGFYDLAPYDLHWDMFKCLDSDCVKKKSKKCYDWCENWGETGGRHNCRMRCLDYADMYTVDLRANDHIFNRNLPKFKYFSLLRNSADWF